MVCGDVRGAIFKDGLTRHGPEPHDRPTRELRGLAQRASTQDPTVFEGAKYDGDTYGHPAPSTLSALRGVPQLVRTDRDGTVRLRVSGGEMQLERERG
jgi:hypothetical protein